MDLFDEIKNYYEQLVTDYFNAQALHTKYDADFLADLFCLTLNKLPPRYIRYAVDMAFFLTSQERAEMEQRVADTVNEYLVFLEARYAKEKELIRQAEEEEAQRFAQKKRQLFKEAEAQLAAKRKADVEKLQKLLAEKEQAERAFLKQTTNNQAKHHLDTDE